MDDFFKLVIDRSAEQHLITFEYKNWRGEISQRRAAAISVEFGMTEWHPEPQWLLRAADLDTGFVRFFAMRDMTNMHWLTVGRTAASSDA